MRVKKGQGEDYEGAKEKKEEGEGTLGHFTFTVVECTTRVRGFTCMLCMTSSHLGFAARQEEESRGELGEEPHRKSQGTDNVSHTHTYTYSAYELVGMLYTYLIICSFYMVL